MWEELDMELDPAFLERDALRKAGRPVRIAETEHLLIRETILADVPGLYEIYEQAGVKGQVKPMQPTLQEELDFMEAYIRHAYSFYDYGIWTVLEKKSGAVIGRAGLFPSEILEDAVELGYLIAPAWQRHGFAKECGRAILQYAGQVLELSEVHLLADCRNTASMRTAAALGFKNAETLHRDGEILAHFIKDTCLCTGKNGETMCYESD